MKIIQESHKAALTSGNMEVHNVGISDDPEDQMMILNVLSNSLYTDKVAAVLREYGCNAADANVEAGRGKQPIEVRLPNRLDPTVAIRDFGAGMTPEQIVNTFIKLGRSTKRNSNAFTGMLGIGSKAGFAYGDSFVVTSWTEGHMAVYNLYRDKGLLKMVSMFSGPSDGPDGVEVKVPVRTEHWQEFVTKARDIYSYFKVRPIIHGAKVEWINREESISGKDWRYTNAEKSVAIMGNVAYTLDVTAMGFAAPSNYAWNAPALPTNAADRAAATLISLGVELDFRIGDLEIAANREGLQYSDVTKQALRDTLSRAAEEIGEVFSKKLAGATSLWEARCLYGALLDEGNSRGQYSIKSLIKASGGLKWGIETIDKSAFDLESAENSGVQVTRFSRGGRRYNAAPNAYRTHANCWHIDASKGVTLMINDLPSKKHSPARIKEWLYKNPTCKDIVVFTFDTPSTQAAYWKARKLTGAPTTLLSSITPPPPTPSAGGNGPHNSKHSTKVFTLDEKNTRGYDSVKSSLWEQTSVNLKKDSGVFVTIEAFAVREPDVSFSFAEHPTIFADKVKKIRAAGLLDATQPIYGIKLSATPGPGWVRLDQHIENQLTKLRQKADVDQQIADSIAAFSYVPLLPACERGKFASGTSIHKLLDEWHNMTNPKIGSKLCQLLQSGAAAPWLKKISNLPTPSLDFGKQESLVLQDYPMLSNIQSFQLKEATGKLLNNVLDYTRLVESV